MRIFFLIALLGMSATFMAADGCGDSPTEDAIEDTKDAAEEVGDEIEDATN